MLKLTHRLSGYMLGSKLLEVFKVIAKSFVIRVHFKHATEVETSAFLVVVLDSVVTHAVE